MDFNTVSSGKDGNILPVHAQLAYLPDTGTDQDCPFENSPTTSVPEARILRLLFG
jgi:hypothetical protein